MISNLLSKFLESQGYRLYRCPQCKAYYYGFNSTSCGEYPEKSYEFIDKKRGIINSLKDFIKLFNKFFEERGHAIINRYPVIARWRDDLLLTIASIACFQPWVTEGIVEAPANPLVIHQPCMRFEDFRNVGYTGRHTIAFTMSAHHAFNKYWKEEMLEYCFRFFTEELKIDKEDITFKLSVWYGGGNAGECYEVIINGLEVSTLVLMHYKLDPNGSIEIEGEKYSEMPIRIIDTGYGAERIVWLMSGKSNVFEANYSDLISHLSKYFKITDEDKEYYKQKLIEGKINKKDSKIKKLAEMYRLIDLLRVICLLAHDGAVPSNKKEGYLLRLAIRQVYSILWRFTEKEDIKEEIKLMIEWIKDNLDPKFDLKVIDYIYEILEIEKNKFAKIIDSFNKFDFNKIKSVDEVIKLYETRGLPIFYFEDKIPFDIDEIFERITVSQVKQGSKKVKREKIIINIPDNIPSTKKEYYKSPYKFEDEAEILWMSEDGKYVILDKTIFYPEGGGQPSDTGYINDKKVKKVFMQKDKIIHELE